MQSSKQASKGVKKDRIAIRATLKDDDGGLIVSSDDSESSSSPFSSPTSQPHSPPKKKKRGLAKTNFIPPMDGKCLKVRFNERGQLVGKTSNRLVSFIGYLVRRMVPTTLSTWHKVDNECRERLQVCVKIKIKKYKPTSSGNSGSFTEDAIGAILWREQNGRVRGLGFGATPSRVTLQEHNKSYVARLEKQLRDLKEQFVEFNLISFNKCRFAR
ncbi:hypothetical protein LWI28_019404 [Acer negundo]|uniref:Transposase n=1 Tax=Acer negundo TaxID=4023 RepID=A0AAD5IVG1_ACENE|nr:hypothetical protein LWI28_019404 [Acer negundo]KAK4852561.1 hypothetical protein QYF36_025040 [Acer negundo]